MREALTGAERGPAQREGRRLTRKIVTVEVVDQEAGRPVGHGPQGADDGLRTGVEKGARETGDEIGAGAGIGQARSAIGQEGEPAPAKLGAREIGRGELAIADDDPRP